MEKDLTVFEVAEILSLTAQSVRNFIKRGDIPAYRLKRGRKLYVKQKDLKLFRKISAISSD